MGGIPARIAPTISTAGKTISGTFIDLFSKPELLAETKREFDERVANEPMPTLLSEGFVAPIDLPWPHYRPGLDGTNEHRHW